MFLMLLNYLVFILLSDVQAAGILYPRASESREIQSLDGLWNFAMTDTISEIDFDDIPLVPVPSSYNDLGVDTVVRDRVGIVLYQRNFFVPKSWNGQRVWLRFSSVCRGAEVLVNNKFAVSHDIGHLPFQAEVSSLLNYGTENSIAVLVDNELNSTTVPQGSISTLDSGRVKQSYTFDFMNYAGIDRPVVLYTTPQTYIDDITISTDIDGADGFVDYEILVAGSDPVIAKVSLLNTDGEEVVSDTVLKGSLFVQNANFWWPYLMDPNPGYLYSLQVQLLDTSGNIVDKYSLPVGIRKITWDSTTVNINNKPIYLRGFGRHEDSDIRGKGLDLPLIIRDHNLIRWIGANAYRTSHYPYAEEIMDLADQLGIMIIDESPSADTDGFSDELLENHKQSLTELIQRDKNRPGVIMWSASNEPKTQHDAAEDYYKQVIGHIKSLDSSRPVTVVNAGSPDNDYSGQFLDVACINIYYGWYSNTGDIDMIVSSVVSAAKRWNEFHNIPVIVAEYGADTQEGLHILPAFVWSEEYQDEILAKHFEAFDQLREEGFLVGELIWNFADFKTSQSYTRVGGNKKGIFTRNRQPKAAAHLLRKRYWNLAHVLDNATLPEDLDLYIVGTGSKKDEL